MSVYSSSFPLFTKKIKRLECYLGGMSGPFDRLIISAKTLGALALDDCCPACFWTQHHRRPLPFQMFPSIFGDIDRFTKRFVHAHIDEHGREPPCLEEIGPFTGYIEPPHWRRFQATHPSGLGLRGEADGMLLRGDGSMVIVDYKTARYTEGQDRLLPVYEVQLTVPSPSSNPRLADELIVEHQEFLQEGDRLVPENVLRISEDNPFEAYHEILETIREYATTYKNLGGCIVFLSCHASKLLSLAVLLAADDSRRRDICKRVTIEFVEARAHRMSDTPRPPGVPHTMWLAGEPFLIKERREKA